MSPRTYHFSDYLNLTENKLHLLMLNESNKSANEFNFVLLFALARLTRARPISNMTQISTLFEGRALCLFHLQGCQIQLCHLTEKLLYSRHIFRYFIW